MAAARVSPSLRVGEVDLPGPLVDAAWAGELVVFAGAGVSKGPPSNLPLFGGLVQDVKGSVRTRRKRGEPEDVYLGRLETAGLDVERRVRRQILRRGSGTTPLHTTLVRLFESPERLRIVTTNYDDHFETACGRAFGAPPRLWSAPALPDGSAFEGLVHLHGRAADEASRLVVTDRDFGSAYLTQGWARDFLVRLYSRYVVVFVGYSHADTIVSYLARGLTAGARERYALTATGALTAWDVLGVTPVPYPPTPDHGELTRAVIGWAEATQRDPISADLRMARVIGTIEATGDEDVAGLPETIRSEVRRAVWSGRTVTRFTRYAGDPRWLEWLLKPGVLDVVFGDEPVCADDEDGDDQDENGEDAACRDERRREQALATWFVRRFVVEHRGAARALVQAMGRTPSRLADRIASEVYAARDRDVLAYWVPMVAQAGISHERATELLDAAREHGDSPTGLLMLDRVMRPEAKANPNHFWGAFGEEAAETRTHVESPQALDQDWTKEVFEQAWAWLWDDEDGRHRWRMLTTAGAGLAQGHDVHRTGSRAYGEWDAWAARVSRDAASGVQFLFRTVDAAVSTVQGEVEWVEGLLEGWRASRYPLLEQLGLKALARDLSAGRVDVDSVVDLLVRRGWLLGGAVSDAAEPLLVATLPSASAELHQAVQEVMEDAEADEALPHQLLRVLGVIEEALSPDVPGWVDILTKRAQTRMPERARRSVATPLTVEDLRTVSPADLVERLDAHVRSVGETMVRRPTTWAVETLARRDAGWALAMMRALGDAGLTESPVWFFLFKALDARDNAVVRGVLDALAGGSAVPGSDEATHWLATALRSGVEGWSESDDAVVDRVLDAAERAESVDRVGLAVAAAVLRATHGTSPDSALDAVRRAVWEGGGGEWSKLFVALDRLRAVDAEWVRSWVLPAVGPTLLSDEAFWAAVLGIYHPPNRPQGMFGELMDRLVPLFGGVEWMHVRNVGVEGVSTKRQTPLAGAIVETLVDATMGWASVAVTEWLAPFLAAASDRARASWIQGVADRLQSAEGAAGTYWTEWMRGVWDDLLEGDPVEIGEREACALLAWGTLSGVPVGEAADRVLRGPALRRCTGRQIKRWAERASEDPNSVLAVLTRVVRDTSQREGGLYQGYVEDLLANSRGASREARRAFLNELVAAGAWSGVRAEAAL